MKGRSFEEESSCKDDGNEGNRRSSKECASASRRVGRSSMVVARTTCAVKLKMEGWKLNGDGNKLICY